MNNKINDFEAKLPFEAVKAAKINNYHMVYNQYASLGYITQEAKENFLQHLQNTKTPGELEQTYLTIRTKILAELAIPTLKENQKELIEIYILKGA